MPLSRSRVFRRKPWRTGSLRGDFLVAERVVVVTERSLVTFRDAAKAHEGMAFWGGVETPNGVLIMSAVIPACEHSEGRVHCSELVVRDVARALRDDGLGILAQIHSHGTDDARHSEGDDSLVLMPFEGMLSIVVPRYGRYGMRPLEGCGIHQFQDGEWILCTSGLEKLKVVRSCVDLR